MKEHQFSRAVALALLGLAAPAAFGHGGEVHDHEPAPAPLPAGTVSAQRLADGSLFVPKAVQHQLRLRTRPVEIGERAATLEFNGRVVADANAGGRVQASQAGRIEPGPGGLPTLGQRVARGQVLAWLRPTPGSIERSNQLALLAELEAALAIAEQKAERYRQLEGAVPRKEIEAAAIELAALKRRRAAVADGLQEAEPLRAPVAGVIGAASVVAGQVVEARDILFEVVDPGRLAVEALAYDPAVVGDIASAAALLPAGRLELDFVGGGRQLREQAVPLLFRVTGGGAVVAVGQPVKVVARTGRTTRGAAVDQAALVRNGAGETVLWVHAEAERFMPRRVRYQPLDGATVLVTEGLRHGERVVTEGATLLAQVR